MKLLVKFLFVVLSLILLTLIIAFFSDRGFTIKKSIMLSVNSEKAYEYINESTNFHLCQPLFEKTKNSKQWSKGEKEKKGFTGYWKNHSTNFSLGFTEITQLKYPTKIRLETTIKKPNAFDYQTEISFSDKDKGASLLTVTIVSKKPWPTNLFYLFNNSREQLEIQLDVTLKKIEQELKNLE